MSKIDDIFRRVRKSAWLDTRYILVGAYMCMRREDLCILVITRARARVNDKIGARVRANDYRRSFTINAHFNRDGYVEIITRRSSVRICACVCVCVLCARIYWQMKQTNSLWHVCARASGNFQILVNLPACDLGKTSDFFCVCHRARNW